MSAAVNANTIMPSCSSPLNSTTNTSSSYGRIGLQPRKIFTASSAEDSGPGSSLRSTSAASVPAQVVASLAWWLGLGPSYSLEPGPVFNRHGIDLAWHPQRPLVAACVKGTVRLFRASGTGGPEQKPVLEALPLTLENNFTLEKGHSHVGGLTFPPAQPIAWRPFSPSAVAVGCAGGVCVFFLTSSDDSDAGTASRVPATPRDRTPLRPRSMRQSEFGTPGANLGADSPTQGNFDDSWDIFIPTPYPVTSLGWHPDGHMLAVASNQHSSVRLYSLASLLTGGDKNSGSVYTPDSQVLFVSRGAQGIASLSFSPDGYFLAVGHIGGVMRVFETSSWQSQKWRLNRATGEDFDNDGDDNEEYDEEPTSALPIHQRLFKFLFGSLQRPDVRDSVHVVSWHPQGMVPTLDSAAEDILLAGSMRSRTISTFSFGFHERFLETKRLGNSEFSLPAQHKVDGLLQLRTDVVTDNEASIQSICWDYAGSLIAVMLKNPQQEDDSGAVIQLFSVSSRPIRFMFQKTVVLDHKSQPLGMSFRPNMAAGGMLAVVWASQEITLVLL